MECMHAAIVELPLVSSSTLDERGGWGAIIGVRSFTFYKNEREFVVPVAFKTQECMDIVTLPRDH
jgi:hypothetical protein